jgi:hypothetical protein
VDVYIAFFDILGFKEFITNNDKDYVDRYFRHIFRDTQTSLSGQKFIEAYAGVVPDLARAEVNCLQVSDSIIFWSKDVTENSFRSMMAVCYTMNWLGMQMSFALRGCLVKGDIEFAPFQFAGQGDVKYYNSSLYGQGLVEAYTKADSQDWAGCYVDQTAISSVKEEVIIDLIRENKLVYYAVPNKDGTVHYEHVVSVINGKINDVLFRNMAIRLEQVFKLHMNGKPLPDSVRRKLNNTIKFFEFFKDNVDNNLSVSGLSTNPDPPK